jgi:hypothetical protein
MENIFSRGLYFKKHPDNILAEQKEGKSAYGKDIIMYKGDISNVDRIDAVANLTAINYDNPLATEITTSIEDLTSKDVEQFDNIVSAIDKSPKDVQDKKNRDYKKLKAKKDAATSSMEGIETRTLREVYDEINPEISIDELRVFLWHCNQISKPVTNP